MNDITISLPKHLALIIIAVAIVITLGGYALFFIVQGKLNTKDRALESLKEKQINTEENYNELQKNFFGTNAEIKQINKDYEACLKKQLDCRSRYDALQTNYDNLQQTNLLLQQNVQGLQSKLGIKSQLPTEPVQSVPAPTEPVQSVPAPTEPVQSAPAPTSSSENSAVSSSTTPSTELNTPTSDIPSSSTLPGSTTPATSDTQNTTSDAKAETPPQN